MKETLPLDPRKLELLSVLLEGVECWCWLGIFGRGWALAGMGLLVVGWVGCLLWLYGGVDSGRSRVERGDRNSKFLYEKQWKYVTRFILSI